jgi:arylsulfatase A-like enzyme
MSRKNPITLMLAGLLAIVLPAVVALGNQPNIILIMADDLGYGSLGCYGNPGIKTPNIDGIAAAGTRFNDFHSNGPMCSPTRAALLTGRYPQRSAWVDDDQLSPVFEKQRRENPVQRWAWGISPVEVTIARLLRQAGYRTGIIGKWHLGYDFKFHPMNFGFDEFRGFVGGAVDYHSHVATHGRRELDWWKDRKIQNENGYTTDLLGRHASEFITRHKERPFFLYLAHAAPHVPLQGRDPDKKMSPAATYQEMIEILDESVGKVVGTLRAHGLEQKTLLIFCSDNGAAPPRGVAANGRLKGKKGDLAEGGHRVPCIAFWPGVIAPGGIQDQTVMTMDFFPTFAKLAGATPPGNHQIDGIDIMPLMKGDTRKEDRVLHWLFGNRWAVRKGSWKLGGQGGKPLTLVNLEDDLEEKSNLINRQPARADELLARHRTWIAEVGDK